MTARFNIILFLFVGFLFSGCSKEPTGPSSDNFRYPLHVGNTWNYSQSLTLTFNPSSGVRAPEVTTSTIHVVVAGEEIIFDSLKTIKLQEQVFQDEAKRTSYQFYQNASDALNLIATRGAQKALPKMSSTKMLTAPLITDALTLPGFSLTPAADSLNLEKPAKVALKYPLKQGVEWKYSERNKPRRVNKRVLGKVDVQTDVGTFKTVKIQWIIDFDGDGEFDDNVEYFDYIANEGLIKRSFLIRHLPLVDDEGGNIGSYDYHDVSVLSSYNVK